MSQKPIYFYSGSDEYSEFSNFSNFGFTEKGKDYKTMEHYFHSKKSMDYEYAEFIRTAPRAIDAYRRGKSKDFPIWPDWDRMQLHVMRKGLKLKFDQNPHLKRMLINTGDRPIIHETKSHYFWGQDLKGKGENMLGKMMMELREKYKNEMKRG